MNNRMKKIKKFGLALRLSLKDSGLGVRGAARRSGISPSQISKLMHEEGGLPSAEHAAAIAMALGVDTDWLCGQAGLIAPDLADLILQYPKATRKYLEPMKEGDRR